MNCVLATENEKLREEVKKWVQQAVNIQRDLDEAKRKRLELEKENDSLNTEAIQVRKKNKRLLRNIANLHEEIEAEKVCITDLKHEIEKLNGITLEFQNALHEQAISSQQTAMGIEVLQHSIEEYKSQLIEAESKNNFLQKAVNSSESQLLICRKAREVITDDYAQLMEKYQEMSIDFMMWKDEYETLRRKYDDAIRRMERGAEKLRQMASVADQFSVQARTLRQGVIPTRDIDEELSHFLGIIGQCLGRFGCYH
ncbi:glial fibrillary acidic protein-like [Cucumis melo var. makuwa]|uniref:Glial fibrillary acidic protein-like n=1 Tax=Cucumis melo var. makuwa TaxID=1194695 RepID=A0A5A7SM49_CUCMM|nr:glial fibrillary acidic protein-like [Cucumis melo var. makuwa]